MADPVLTIRAYREADETAVVALWQRVFPDERPWNEPAAYIRRKLLVQRELFLVGESAGCLIATVLAGYASEDRISMGKRLG
jgi:hypothetical protein